MSRERWRTFRRRTRALTLPAEDLGLALLFSLLVGALRWLPEQTSQRLAASVARLFYVLRRREVRLACVQLEARLGMTLETARETTRQLFLQLARAVVELARLNPQTLREGVILDGEKELQAALSRGRGMLFLTGHVGNWELLAARLCLDFPLTAVVAPVRYPRLQRLLNAFRTGYGLQLLQRGTDTDRSSLLACLEQGRMLGLLLDQRIRTRGMIQPFFGAPVQTPTLPLVLALQQQIPIWTGFIHRQPSGRHTVVLRPIEDGADLASGLGLAHPEVIVGAVDTAVDEAVEDSKGCVSSPARDARVQAVLQIYLERLEQAIRQEPAAWPWFHRRWSD